MLLGMSAPTETLAQTVQREIYFACEEGWTFQVNQNAARCIAADEYIPSTEHAPTCPQPHTTLSGITIKWRPVVDFQRDMDFCVSTELGTIWQEPMCPDDYPQHAVSGPDDCAKYVGEKSIPPKVQVFRKEPSPQPFFGIFKE